MPIEILSDHTVAQIAAGEVVERPASVVKELMENALDAGASNIHVAVGSGGRKFIRISDDGAGIAAEEVALAFARHATSKLRTIDDLSMIATLGFRGEALSSIAAVSRVDLTTRHRDEAVGTRLRIEGSRVSDRQAVGAPAGTVISVENLFYNTPARLKFLKKEATEKKHITALVTRYAMAYPDVRFILEMDGRELFRSTGSGELADVAVKVVGLENFRQMVAVESIDLAREDRPTVRVTGFVSLPEFNRADRSHVSIFVNGRWVQDSSLTYAVVQAYHALLTGGRYPVTMLMMEIAPQEVDVNVHPTKAEVRFRNPKAVFSALQRAVREAVISASQPSHRFRSDLPRDSGGGTWRGMPGQQMNMELALDEHDEAVAQRGPQRQTVTDPGEIPEGPGMPLKPRTLPMLRVVGQVGASYIVAEGPSGMYLIDQHSAHQRILLEALEDSLAQSGQIEAQEISAGTVELSRDEAGLVERYNSALAETGILLEPFGPGIFVARGLPEAVHMLEPGEVIGAIVNDLLAQPRLSLDDFRVMVLRRLSSLGAVRSGQILQLEEMQRIIRQLERCRNPREDAFGKPTLLHMSGDQLAREFGR